MVLRGATGALALPLLNDIPRAQAQSKSVDAGPEAGGPARGGPKRLIVMFSPNGTIPSAFASTGSGPTFTLGPILSPLVMDGHKNDLIVVHNLDISASADGPGGDAHGLGIGCLLTGIELQSGMQFLAGCGVPGQFCGASGWPSGGSIDQFIARRFPQTQRLSIDFAIKRMPASIWSRAFYSGGNGLTVEPFDDPTVAFNSLFANVGVGAPTVALQTSRRKSVLDRVSSELQALSASLSGQDKFKVDAHLTLLRQIEMQLSVTNVVSGCVKPPAPSLGASATVVANASGMEVHTDPTVDMDVPLRNTLAQQMLVAAMACDMARVGTIMMAPSRSDIFLTWLPGGSAESHHDLSHEPDSNAMAQQKLIQINQWYAKQVSQVITALKAMPENGGTMFDNTALLWCNELGIGNNHSHTNIPVMLAGNAGGYFKTGQAVTMPPGTPQNRLLLSLCHAMGLSDVTTFGNPKFCTAGPIAEIKA